MRGRTAASTLAGALAVVFVATFASALRAQQPEGCATLQALVATLGTNLEAEKQRQEVLGRKARMYEDEVTKFVYEDTFNKPSDRRFAAMEYRKAMERAAHHANASYFASGHLIDAMRTMIVQSQNSMDAAGCATAAAPPSPASASAAAAPPKPAAQPQAAAPDPPPQATASSPPAASTPGPPNRSTYTMTGYLQVCGAKERVELDFTVHNGQVLGTYIRALKLTGTVDAAGKTVLIIDKGPELSLQGTMYWNGRWEGTGTFQNTKYPLKCTTSYWTVTERR